MIEKKVVAILVNYNGIKNTIECIESIRNSTAEIKIVVVDNASKNDELAVIKEQFTDVVGIASEVNGGFSYGNNLGIRWAIENEYDYVLLLNNDTIIEKYMIEILCSYASENVITTPTMYYHSNPEMIWYGGGYIDKWTGNAKHMRMNEVIDVEKLVPEDCTFSTGCCMLINTMIFNKIGLLNEELFMYCEDTEFCIRAIQNGIRIEYIPQAKLWHKVSASTGGSDSPFSTYYMTRNRLACISSNKNYFKITAMAFSIITRKIRALLSKDKKMKNAFNRGINDYKKGISGKVAI